MAAVKDRWLVFAGRVGGLHGFDDQDPASKAFSDRYQAAYGHKPGAGEAYAYDAAQLAAACGVSLEALDLGFYNWDRGERATVGLGPGAEPDQALVASVRAGLGIADDD